MLATTDPAALIAWLNDYHATVRQRLAPRLAEAADAEALAWLLRRTEPL